MSMTRKHYIDIALAITQAHIDARQAVEADNPTIFKSETASDREWAVDVAIQAVIKEMCTVLKIDNQAFKKDRFTDYIEKGYGQI